MKPNPPTPAGKLLRRALAVLRDAQARAGIARGWGLLQERDSEGNPRGPHAYTEAALAAFEAAQRADPEDFGVLHHLAIARHARAWDLELADDPRAPAEWSHALDLWSRLAASGGFWSELEKRLEACAAGHDSSFLDRQRRHLIEDLLEVHVGFVRHHSEQGRPERAAIHFRIVDAARIAPAAKKRLLEKVFDEMTATVPQAVERGEFEGALSAIERFLDLLPHHLSALRTHAEIAAAWIDKMSYQEQWEKIRKAADRALPPASALGGHQELGRDPLARIAAEALIYLVIDKTDDRRRRLQTTYRKAHDVFTRESLKADAAWLQPWGTLALGLFPADAKARVFFALSCEKAADVVDDELDEISEDEGTDSETKMKTCDHLLRLEEKLLTMARTANPADEDVPKKLERLSRLRTTISLTGEM